MINRRSLITGLISFAAAPAIVRVESLMKLPKPIKVMTMDDYDQLIYQMFTRQQWNTIYFDANWQKIYYDGSKVVTKYIDPKDIYID